MWTTNEAAPRWVEEALGLARESGDDLARSDALSALADALRHYPLYLPTMFRERDTAIRELGDELIEIATRRGDWRVVQMHGFLAIHYARTDPAAMAVHLAKADEAVRRSGDVWGSAMAAVFRGQIASDQGRWSDARRWLTEGIQRSRVVRSRRAFVLLSRSIFQAVRWGRSPEGR